MEIWTEIRRKVLVEGASKRSILRDYKVSTGVLEKILSHAEPPGYRQSVVRPKPQLGGFIAVIEQILAGDKTAPPKQRHTASQVRAAAARVKRSNLEVFVPLSHPPGRAQFRFSTGARCHFESAYTAYFNQLQCCRFRPFRAAVFGHDSQ
jgi:hypothetical protein